MLRIGFIGSTTFATQDPDDAMAADALRARGAHVDYLMWDNPDQAWDAHDLYVNRCTWRYQFKYAQWLSWLDQVAANLPILNPAPILRMTSDKRYMTEIEAAGVVCVPSLFIDMPELAADAAAKAGWTEIVVKPAIGASGFDTFKCPLAALNEKCAAIMAANPADGHQSLMIQPFIDHFVTTGEWSLIFIDNIYSHAVFKTAGAGEFRVQSRWGGTTVAAEAPAPLIAQAQAILDRLAPDLLYARIDGIYDGAVFTLSELEWNEPYLSFGADPAAAARFADAVLRRANSSLNPVRLRA